VRIIRYAPKRAGRIRSLETRRCFGFGASGEPRIAISDLAGGASCIDSLVFAPMQVRETTLKELIQGEKQFRVPLWQRQYTWRRDEHLLLWIDILEQYSQLGVGSAAPVSSGHFLGSFVLSPAAFAASDVASFLIVDGQQRMTTLLLVLCALRDAQMLQQPQAADRINELYLVNKWKVDLPRFGGHCLIRPLAVG